MDTETLETCDILLYQGTSFTSRLIQWGTNSPYSHVAVVVHPPIHLAIESNTGHQSGVRSLDLRKLDDASVDVFRVRPEFPYDADRVISHLVSRLGAPYDFCGVFFLGVLKVLSYFTGFKLLRGYNQFQKDRDYFCSELVYEAFDQAGLDIVPQVDAAEVTSPGDIARSERLERVKKAEIPLLKNVKGEE